MINTSRLQIGEVARRAGVSIRAVRYYEEKELLTPDSYTSAGMRLYTTQDVTKLIFIRRFKNLGLNVKEIEMCFGKLPELRDRQQHVEHTLELLRMQKKKVREESTKLKQFDREIDNSLEKVNRCLKCKAEKCSEQCVSFGYVL